MLPQRCNYVGTTLLKHDFLMLPQRYQLMSAKLSFSTKLETLLQLIVGRCDNVMTSSLCLLGNALVGDF